MVRTGQHGDSSLDCSQASSFWHLHYGVHDLMSAIGLDRLCMGAHLVNVNGYVGVYVIVGTQQLGRPLITCGLTSYYTKPKRITLRVLECKWQYVWIYPYTSHSSMNVFIIRTCLPVS